MQNSKKKGGWVVGWVVGGGVGIHTFKIQHLNLLAKKNKNKNQAYYVDSKKPKNNKKPCLLGSYYVLPQSTGDTEIPELSVCLPRGHSLIGKADVR